jgi:CDP-diacylglycerol--glycerol-3-phosphate 3-phosphatidyltransferase
LTKPGIVKRFATECIKPGSPGLLPDAIVTGRAERVCHEIRANRHHPIRGLSILDGVSARAVSAPLAQIPNALTILRLALIPVFVGLLIPADGGYSWPAAIVFAIAGITDQVDGWLARRWHVESQFGKVADPLADRLMIDAAVILLVAVHHRLPWAALVLVLARDALLIGGYKLIVPRGYELSVNFLGKVATWVLYASLAFVMVTHDGTDWPLWIFWTGVVLALAAGAQYLFTALRTVRR